MNKVAMLLTASVIATAGVDATHVASAGSAKNVVLVHGAFADGSGWKAVAAILRKQGLTVRIAQPPETSLEDDIAATNRVLDGLDGPAVLVGHSYGGMIITEAGNNAHVQSLVYVAALAPDTGESAGQLLSSKPAATNFIVPSKDGYLSILPEHFHDAFGADLPKAETDFMAASQVTTSGKALGATAVSPAWKSKPTFAIVAVNDRAINPDLERSMYSRARAQTTEVVASHAVYISQPAAVAKVIAAAAAGAAK